MRGFKRTVNFVVKMVGVSVLILIILVVAVSIFGDYLPESPSSKEETVITEAKREEPHKQETQACTEYAAARHEILYQLVEQQVQGSSKVNTELDRLRKTFDGDLKTLCNLKPKSEYVAEVIRVQEESSRRFREGLEKEREERRRLEVQHEEDVDRLCEKAEELQYRVGRRESYNTVKRLDDEIEKEIERLGLSSNRAQWCDKVSGIYFDESGSVFP